MTAQTSPDLPDSQGPYIAAAAAGIEAGHRFAIGQSLDEQLPWLAGLTALDPRFRAAVDEAVRLTEQRVRAELGRPSLVEQNLRLMREVRQLTADLAAMGADHLGQPPTPMPATHQAALTGVQWPTQEVAR